MNRPTGPSGSSAPAAVPYVVPAADRVAFLGCRRAWDLGARERGNHRRASRCARCEFRPPCTSMNLGEDPAGLLAAGYVQRAHDPAPGRLGGGTWSTGRGAAPPGFGG